jgi:hypothetical protein
MGLQPMAAVCRSVGPIKPERTDPAHWSQQEKIAALWLVRPEYRSNVTVYRDHGLETHATAERPQISELPAMEAQIFFL